MIGERSGDNGNTDTTNKRLDETPSLAHEYNNKKTAKLEYSKTHLENHESSISGNHWQKKETNLSY